MDVTGWVVQWLVGAYFGGCLVGAFSRWIAAAINGKDVL